MLIFGGAVVVVCLAPLKVARVGCLVALHGDGRFRHHDDMMPLRGVSALVILVDSADAVAHRLRRHVSALGNGNVDVVSDSQTGEVGVSRAVAKPRVNVGAADLVSEDRSERAPRVSVDVVLAVVFLGGRDRIGLALR